MIKFIIKSAPVFLLAIPAAPAAEIPSPVTASATVALSNNDTITTREIKVADGATLTILRSGSGGALFPSLGTGTLAIGPVSEGGTGRVVFKDIYRNTAGGSILGITTDATVNITGADFIGNSVGVSGVSGVSGVFQINAGDAAVTMRDVLFEGNFSHGNSGVARIQNGAVLISGGTFRGNYAPTAQIGVFGIQAATGRLALDNVLFEANRAKTTSGALEVGAFAYSATFTNVVFKDNWAGTFGGAIRAAHTGGELVLKMTEETGTNYYKYTGNIAGQAGVTVDAVIAGAAPAARAAAGGFYYGAGAGALRFDIDAGVTLAIGDPGAADKNIDSIATNAAGAAAKIIKTGGGDLILNADNSSWRGSTVVSSGRLLLGNDAALLGSSTITIAAGAAFGGFGKAANAGAAGAANVIVSSGATLQVGVAGAAAGAFSIDGRLALDNATISYVASAAGTSSRFDHNGVTIETGGTNILNMQGFASGTYNLGAVALYNTLIANGADTLRFAANGDITVSDAVRQGAKLIPDASDFLVGVWTSPAARIKWNGPATGGAWNNYDDNWQGVNDPGVIKFASGDLVEFQADAAARSVDLASPVFVTGMTVDGGATTAFAGAGGITAAGYTSGDAEANVAASGSGQLVKRGAGALVFNNGANLFNGGVYVHGGVIEIQRGDQLQTGVSAIAFKESGTLRVTGSAQLPNNIMMDAGRSAVIDTAGGLVVLSGGVVSGAGTLVKDGPDTLRLASANTHAATELRRGSLALWHDQALGAGPLNVTGGNASVAVLGGVTIGNAINAGANNLRIYNALLAADAPAAVFSGAINGGALIIEGFFDAGSGYGSGPLTLAGANALGALTVRQYAKIVAASPGALGGAASVVSVEGGGSIVISRPGTRAASMRVYDGGKISFRNAAAGVPLLKLAGDFILDEGSVVDLGGAPSGSIWLVDAASVTNNAIFEAGDAEISVTTGNGDLRVTKINPAVYAGKDVAAAFDVMTAATGAVHSRLGESFLMPMMERRPGDPARDFWIKGVGSFSDYDSAPGRIGFTGRAYGGMAGYDKLISSRLLVGGYVGYNYNSIKTDNHAGTEAEMPHAGVYGAVKLGQLYFAADLMAGSIDADTSRFEQTGYAKGNYKADVLGGGAEIGYVITPWKNGAIKPAFSVAYMGLGYKDQGENGPGAVLVDDFRAERWDSFMSVRVSQGFTLARRLPATVDFLFGWRAALRADPAVITAQLSNNLGDKVRIGSADEYGKAGCVAGLGLRFGLGAGTTLAFAYDYENARDHDRHTLNASLRRNW